VIERDRHVASLLAMTLLSQDHRAALRDASAFVRRVIAKPRFSSGCGNPARLQLIQNSLFEGYL
jgi:hypothetical protein